VKNIISRNLRQIARSSRSLEFTWRYLFNLQSTLTYRKTRHALSSEAARALVDLNRDGVAITNASALVGTHAFDELKAEVDKLEKDLGDSLATARTAASDPEAIGSKTFNVELLGSRPVLDPDSIYARFALQDPILQIANAYFGMYTRLRYYNVWHTFATQSQARESQLWHRDREDHFILKVFVYFSDVDNGGGPFTYAKGSHPKRKLRKQPEYFLEGGVKRSDDRQMAEVVPPNQWVKGTGPKGTIIFADTQGYHKGGLARDRDRIMYTCMFTSPASESKELFELPSAILPPADRERRFALSVPALRNAFIK
jgi:hypothetical protein